MRVFTLIAILGLAASQTFAQGTYAEKVESAEAIFEQANQLNIRCFQMKLNRHIIWNVQDAVIDDDILACEQEVSTLRTDANNLLTEAKFSWRLVTDDPSMMDASPTLTLAKLSRQENSCTTGHGENFIVMRCLGGRTSLFFHLGQCKFSRERDAGLSGFLRAGTEPAIPVVMIGRNSMLIPNVSGGAIPLITSMFGEERLVIRAQPRRSPEQTIVFDISGLEEAITPLREACHW